MRSFYDLMGVPPTGFDPDKRFVTSWLLPPTILGSLRLLFAVFGWINIFGDWGWDGTHGAGVEIGRSFSYFTNLTWWGITCYMTISAIHTFVYAIKGRYWLGSWPRPLQLLHTFFYTTIVTFPFLVTIVYWAILYSGHWFTVRWDAFSNVSRHGLNSLAALLEVILPATNPPPFLHIPFLWLLLLLYLSLAYLTHATQGFYVYDFLDPKNGSGEVAGYTCGIAVAIVVIFLIVYGVIWVRRKFTGVGKRSRRDSNREVRQTICTDVEMSEK